MRQKLVLIGIILILSIVGLMKVYSNSCKMTEIKRIQDFHLMVETKTTVNAPNLPCNNCAEHIYNAWTFSDIEPKLDYIIYVCACCGKPRLITHYLNVMSKPAMAKMFKQAIASWSDDLDFNPDQQIATFSYNVGSFTAGVLTP